MPMFYLRSINFGQSLNFGQSPIPVVRPPGPWPNKKGMVTIPFLMVSAVILFFVMAFFGLAWTLSHVSIVQYMTYSAARKYSLGGKDNPNEQIAAGKAHYVKLRGGGSDAKFFKNLNSYSNQNDGWLYISPNLETNIGESTGWDLPQDGRNMFYGVTAEFRTRIAKFCIPFLSPPSCSDDLESGNKGKMYIHSFLGREPSQQECEYFTGIYNGNSRLKAIKTIFRGRGINDFQIPSSPPPPDNGC